VDIELTRKTDDFMSYIPLPESPYMKQLDDKGYKKTLDDLIENEDEFFAQVLCRIVDVLHQEAELGCTLYQLKSKMDGTATDDDILKAVHILCSNDPALVGRVGFNAVRYVHSAFISQWCITEPSRRASKKGVVLVNPDERLRSLGRKPVVFPNLWTDINGNITELILKECKEAVVDLVVRKPGITEAHVHRNLKTALTRKEVHDLLNILVDQQVLRKLQISVMSEVDKKPSIFSKTKQVFSTKSKIERLTQTCFWSTPHCYSGMA
jgi:hypothetical protein